MNPKAASYLGLAMRAGKLTTGDENVLKAIRSSKCSLVLMAEDASANTQKKFRDKCKSYSVRLLEHGSRHELGAAIGKEERVLIAVLDPGFARQIAACLGNLSEVKPID
ncbi:L7Ae/L30e/S12e/Gadd45 family ribosomal protein [Paenibacillus koleovorans]|uniref:L7Ae/L30e/S12e/Gadd45 family ribosomal protein n=1 Tax=Paenibacillus koleovorans TaxID=121608 RepID=UPI000FD8E023|nr:ribosomal L7Ae/L30e/S12e/Gadd45 family protein [Paenibacillus koleovorans]